MTIPQRICLSFFIVITVGTLFLMLPISLSSGEWNNPITALFTATSAVCVTGLSIVDVGKFYSFWGQLFLVILVQIGGLGYMTISTFLLILLGKKFRLKQKVAMQQSWDQEQLGNVIPLLKSILAITVLFELTGVFLLMLIFIPENGFSQGLWSAIFHSINSFNNAGFGLYSDSFMRYVDNPLVNFTVMSLIIFGGLGYQVIMEMYMWVSDRLQKKRICPVFSLHYKVVTNTTLFLIIIGFFTLFLAEYHNHQTIADFTWQNKILATLFQAITPRTAGFNTLDISQMTNSGLLIIIALMFLGASPGGTGGGVKTTTTRILLNSTRAAFQGKDEVLCYQRQIPTGLIIKAIGAVFGSAVVIVIATVIISMIEKIDLIQVLFEVVSAFATVGLSTGITASLKLPSILVLIATMYIGRVSILLFMAAIFGDSKSSSIQYPEENLLV